MPYTRDEAAAELGVSTRTVDKYMADGVLKFRKYTARLTHGRTGKTWTEQRIRIPRREVAEVKRARARLGKDIRRPGPRTEVG